MADDVPRLPAKARPRRAGDPERLGGYEVIGFLGEGGMGSVYLGRGPGPGGGLVAIKVVRSDHARHATFRERFRYEAAHALKVPRFCTAEVLDADPDAEHPYLVTEYIDGPTLDEALEEGGPLRRAELEQLGVSMAAALAGIHGAGVVHRDLKPGNVLLSRMGPRVIDFGIASALDATQGLTATGQLVGTPSYMAPEQFEGAGASEASDVFAWGAVMAFAATGRRPFGTGPSQAIAYRIVHAEPDLEGIEEPLREVVAAALAKDPAHRPTARDLLSRLGVPGGDPAAAAASPGARGAVGAMGPAGGGQAPPPPIPPALPPDMPPPPPSDIPTRADAPPPHGWPQAGTPTAPVAMDGRRHGPEPTLPAGAGRTAPRRRRGPLLAGLAAGAALLLAGALAMVIVPRLSGDDHTYLNGHYNSTYGDMYIRTDGEDVWMIYRWRGKSKIRGVVEGNGRSVYACYTEGVGTEPTGKVRFTIVRNGAGVRLDGKWGATGGALNSDWEATRVDGEIPADIDLDLHNAGLFPAAPTDSGA
ncbi:hypothetical protein Acsp03_05160 [Actinomadura sp. NBRC 104412]|uniref:serine/threonine-protein kinase n=1 Tax=Actinomadura sp. NBRC 104412 TaxID=3032203 RepID=UPI0024A36298|nr:serine/threonine-protein kinase [Actinomadura sp. NBRC 104412]GLZ03049.1 hypothetical protein Acsp03_05160 [Actinomadura sp. NBRC 104412]